MRGYTIKQPWAGLIAGDVPTITRKRFENRGTTPPPAVRGARIAIHAGLGVDRDALDDVLDMHDTANWWYHNSAAPPPVFHHGAIIATALVVGYVQVIRDDCGDVIRCRSTLFAAAPAWLPPMADLEADPARWYLTGPFAWMLDDVRRLPEPVPCKGALGPWRVPADLLPILEARCSAARESGS